MNGRETHAAKWGQTGQIQTDERFHSHQTVDIDKILNYLEENLCLLLRFVGQNNSQKLLPPILLHLMG